MTCSDVVDERWLLLAFGGSRADWPRTGQDSPACSSARRSRLEGSSKCACGRLPKEAWSAVSDACAATGGCGTGAESTGQAAQWLRPTVEAVDAGSSSPPGMQGWLEVPDRHVQPARLAWQRREPEPAAEPATRVVVTGHQQTNPE